MKRSIITIDEEKCDGCGLCIGSCHEGALAVIDGKARLVSEVYCDGLGACLGECPQGAISVEEREAPAFDQQAVDRHLADLGVRAAPVAHECQCHGGQGHGAAHQHHHGHGHHDHGAGHACPGAAMRQRTAPSPAAPATATHEATNQLTTWPLQLRLVPPHAPFLAGAHLLVCADCVPFAVPDFHSRYLAGKVVLVACPKLDDNQANLEKLAAIFHAAQPASVTVLRMAVPCCGGLAQAAMVAHEASGSTAPISIVTVAIPS